MQQFFRLKALVVATAAALALAACGGGGGDGLAFYPPAPAAIAEPALAPASPESVGFSSDRLKTVIEKAHAFVDNSKGAAPPGIAVYVARHGKIVFDDVYGKSDLASGAPLKADAIYRIYSQTKPVTAVAMLKLYEQGKWTLDDPVTKFIPEFANLKVYQGKDDKGNAILVPALRPATMRELMTHTAGFAYGLVPGESDVDDMYRASNMLGQPGSKAFIDKLASLPLAYQPGEKWKYSIAMDVQGVIVERLSGQSFPQFMQDNIFGPLRMKDTGFYVPEDKRSRLATLYGVDPASGQMGPYTSGLFLLDIFSNPPVLASGGGGLVSTTADYARFAQMLLKGGALEGARILKPETVKLMMSNHLSDKVQAYLQANKVPVFPGAGFGFGLNGAVVVDPAKSPLKQGNGTYSWGGAAGTTFWVDRANDMIVLGMIHVLGLSGSLNALSPSIYDALTDPSR